MLIPTHQVTIAYPPTGIQTDILNMHAILQRTNKVALTYRKQSLPPYS